MKIKGKTIRRSSLVMILAIACLLGIVFAQAYIAITKTFHFTISASGNIQLLDKDGNPYVAPSYTFANDSDIFKSDIYVKNTGNCPVQLNWNMTETYVAGTGWKYNNLPISPHYEYYLDASTVTMRATVENSTDNLGTAVVPNTAMLTVKIPVGETVSIRLVCEPYTWEAVNNIPLDLTISAWA